jgi:hypothetical protein
VHTPSINDTLTALASAKASGVRVFRFFASIWGPGQAYWATNPGPFWAEFDAVMAAIERAGLYCIPSIGTNKWARVANRLNPTLNESLRDEVTNTSSVAQSLAKRYFHEIVTRYKSSPAVLFWELGNEMNLQVSE